MQLFRMQLFRRQRVRGIHLLRFLKYNADHGIGVSKLTSGRAASVRIDFLA